MILFPWGANYLDIYNKDTKPYVLHFNGEVYNHLEIKKILEPKNYEFNTNNSSEVIIPSYKEFGTKIINHLRGMFSFIIWEVLAKLQY